MALSLDDKLLGEKTHYYCSSSEDEGPEDDEGVQEEEGYCQTPAEAEALPRPEVGKYDGRACNTGPKGVVNDWRKFKQLETEKREAQEREKIELAKKLTLTCRSHLDEEKEKAKDENFLSELDKEIEELMEDQFLAEYRAKRIEEMRQAYENIPKFGQVYSLTKPQFVEAIDKEKPTVTIIVHIYQDEVAGCQAMNGCLKCLAEEYPTVKFCKIRASEAKLSFKFAENGVPALLIYKKGELIGNFIRLSDEFGHDFYASDIEGFLLEHGFLPDKDLIPKSIKNPAPLNLEDSDSD